MSEIKAPNAEKLTQIIDFLNKELRPDIKWSMEQEYPMTFTETNANNIRFIEEDGQIISHAVLKNMIVKTPMAILKVAGIGSVVTKKEFRNKGYSKSIIQSCVDHAQNQGCDVAILWTDLYEFYRGFGFELAGSEIALTIEKSFKSEELNYRILDSSKVSADAVLKLYNQHTVTAYRTIDEIKQYLKIPNSKVYTAWDENNQLMAYAVEGRGADLTNFIHEWGGNTSSVLYLLSKIMINRKDPLTLISPAHAYNLITKLINSGAKANAGFLGMIKILNHKDLFFKIQRYSRSLGIDNLVLESSPQGFNIGAKNKVYNIQSELDLVKIIFGPSKPSELGGFDAESAKILDKIFPLPLWVWGWDSV